MARKVTALELIGIRRNEIAERLQQAQADVYALQGALQICDEMLNELITGAQASDQPTPGTLKFDSPLQEVTK